jgi:hypothetical protein
MLELRKISTVFSGVPVRDSKHGSARFMRLADLTDVKAGRVPTMVRGDAPEVARALPIKEGDLIVAARGSNTDVCTASACIIGAYISLDLYLVRPERARINSEYLRTVLELPSTQIALANEKQGTGLARLPKEALEKTKIAVPSLGEQKLVAQLALALADEQRLMKMIGELKSCLNRELLSRAVENTDKKFARRSA